MGHDTLANDIFDELLTIPTIDAHEHLPPEDEQLGQERDVIDLFGHYCTSDLITAGASADDMASFYDKSTPLANRWERFWPWFSAIRTTSYARAALLFIRDILEIPELNDDTYEEASAKLSAMNGPGLYDQLLKQQCGLAACIQCWRLEDGPYPDCFYHLAPGPEVLDLTSRTALDELAASCDHPIHRLDDVLACMETKVARWQEDPRVVGVKSAHAYQRSIAFQRVTRHEAEAIFNRILTHETHTLSLHEALPLQDFLVFELMARLAAVDLPMVFHTGLQAGNCNRIANANPLHLQPLLEEFPRARVDLFHGGMPWVGEVAVLAKYFPGVHLNMAWMHLISPEMSRRALAEWLDLVPNTKIFGFGGDYAIVENVYGHLTMAREDIAVVLAGKVAAGAFSRAEASLVARRLLFDNPNNFYRLDLEAH